MVVHAAAFVRWDIFHPGQGTGGAASYDFGSGKPMLVERVKDGGTLWLITSTKRRASKLKYHLAYKLVNCKQIDPHESIFSGGWPFVVRTHDPKQSRHFGYNDATDTVRRLRFTYGKSMSECSNYGTRLVSIPELHDDDIVLLERLQHKIEHGRSVFISYAHPDKAYAETVEYELGDRDVSVSRDTAFLQPGQEFAEALEREVMGTECFVVLVSPASAMSPWVRKELRWALDEFESGGLVKSIVPILLPGGGWDEFPELHRFELWQYPACGAGDFDRLANGISLAASDGG